MGKPNEHLDNANRAFFKAMGWCPDCGAEPADKFGREAEPHAPDCPQRKDVEPVENVFDILRKVAS